MNSTNLKTKSLTSKFRLKPTKRQTLNYITTTKFQKTHLGSTPNKLSFSNPFHQTAIFARLHLAPNQKRRVRSCFYYGHSWFCRDLGFTERDYMGIWCNSLDETYTKSLFVNSLTSLQWGKQVTGLWLETAGSTGCRDALISDSLTYKKVKNIIECRRRKA